MASLACCLTLDSRDCFLNRRWPVDWGWEHTNVVSDPRHGAVAAQLHKAVTQCGPRPDLCPPQLLTGLVH